MKGLTPFVGGAVLGLLLCAGLAQDEASAQALSANANAQRALACYAWSAFPRERYKLDILFHSPLTEKKEEQATGHPPQVVFSVHGKHVGVCGTKVELNGLLQPTVRPMVGTLVSIVPFGQSGGSRLGLETFATTGTVPPFRHWCQDVEISCKAADAGFPPRVWNCYSQNKHPVYHPFSRLVLVNELTDPLCSEYEDGVQDVPDIAPNTDCPVLRDPVLGPGIEQVDVEPASGCVDVQTAPAPRG